MDAAVQLRRARQRAGFTQAELARRAGTSQTAVSAYESAAKQPSLATLTRLLAATGSQLRIVPTSDSPYEPSLSDHDAVARRLLDVLSLAEALPARHTRELRFPRLRGPGRLVV
jgi:transcriptional regulator with XRE-family HTH domain